MNLKRITAGVCGMIVSVLMPLWAYANNDYNYQYSQSNNYTQNQDYNQNNNGYTQNYGQNNGYTQNYDRNNDYTTQYNDQDNGNGYSDTTTTTYYTTTTTTTTTVTQPPTESASNVELSAGRIKDGKFTAEIRISSESRISNASITVEYDKSLLELESSSPNKEAGGMSADNNSEGKYVYNYINRDGTDFDGVYSTLTFRIKDKSMVSAVLYLTVESLDDQYLNPIVCNTENAIVQNPDAVSDESSDTDADSYRRITLQLSKDPVSLESVGIKNAKSCTVANGEILIAENGYLKTLSTGATQLEVTYSDNSKEDFVVAIVNPPQDSYEESSISEIPATIAPENGGTSFKAILIFIAVIVGISLIITEYIVIMKPFGKTKHVKKHSSPQRIYEEDLLPDTESREALEQLLASKTARSEESSAPDIDKLESTQQLSRELIEQSFEQDNDNDDDDDE